MQINLNTPASKKNRPLAKVESWQHELKSALKNNIDVAQFFGLEINKLNELEYPVFITKRFAQKILKAGKDSALWKQFIPSELENEIEGQIDPIGDQEHQKTAQLIHRYTNRVLFIPTTVCPIVCRYCFRKNELYGQNKAFSSDFENTLNYLIEHPEVNELIFSGGDPLVISDSKLENYFEAFSKIDHLKYIRFHTRVPIILPSRITPGLQALLKKYSDRFKISISVHSNHVTEIDFEVEQALVKLSNTRVNLLTQTVLLKGVNDSTLKLKKLFEKFISLDLKPYYLHHPDQAKGTAHFYVDVEKGRRLYHSLRDLLPGWGIPQYVIDLPHGQGKVPLFNPESFENKGVFLNKDLELTFMSEPE